MADLSKCNAGRRAAGSAIAAFVGVYFVGDFASQTGYTGGELSPIAPGWLALATVVAVAVVGGSIVGQVERLRAELATYHQAAPPPPNTTHGGTREAARPRT